MVLLSALCFPARHAFPRHPSNFLEVLEFLEICFVWSLIRSFHERSSAYDSSSCRRRGASAWHSSQNLVPLAQNGPSALGWPPERCTHQMGGPSRPAGSGEAA